MKQERHITSENFKKLKVMPTLCGNIFFLFQAQWLLLDYLYWKVVCSMLLLLSCFSRVWLCATPIYGSPLGSSIPGILQARILKWVAIFFSSMFYGPWPTPLLHPSYKSKGPGQGPFHCATRGTHVCKFSWVQHLERPTGHGGPMPATVASLALSC